MDLSQQTRWKGIEQAVRRYLGEVDDAVVSVWEIARQTGNSESLFIGDDNVIDFHQSRHEDPWFVRTTTDDGTEALRLTDAGRRANWRDTYCDVDAPAEQPAGDGKVLTDGGVEASGGDAETEMQPEAEDVEKSPDSHEIRFSADMQAKLDRAADVGGFEDVEDLIREATISKVDELIDEDGAVECPHDDCDKTFPTVRQRRGHLGSSDHALDVPDGEYWCGYCGYGPAGWRSINAHHGASDHDGDPVRLDEEPDQDDLIAPDQLPDHKNPELLERLYEKHDGNYSAMWRSHDFDVSPGRVRHYLVEFGIHEVTPQGTADDDAEGPLYRDPEWLQQKYDAAGGNVSEMYRRVKDDIDGEYRTLLNTLKRLGIHEPGKRNAGHTQSDSSDESGADSAESDETRSPDANDVDEDESQPAVETAGEDDEKESNGEVDHDQSEEPAAESSGDEPGPDASDVVVVDDPAGATEFADLRTPEWLAEASWEVALSMSDTADELAENLGWGEPEKLRVMIEVLGREDEFTEVDNGGS